MGVSLDLGMSLLSIGRGSTLEGESKTLELAHFSGALAEHGWEDHIYSSFRHP